MLKKYKLSNLSNSKEMSQLCSSIKWKFPSRLGYAEICTYETRYGEGHRQASRPRTQSGQVLKMCWAHSQKCPHSLNMTPPQFQRVSFSNGSGRRAKPAYLTTRQSATFSGSDAFWTEWANKLPAWAQRAKQISDKASRTLTIQTALIEWRQL